MKFSRTPLAVAIVSASMAGAPPVLAADVGSNIDTMISLLNYALPQNVEILEKAAEVCVTLSGCEGNDTITAAPGVQMNANGGLGNDSLTGDTANDIISGGDAGNDTLKGKTGDDAYILTKCAGDAITENASEGEDVVMISLRDTGCAYTMPANVEMVMMVDAQDGSVGKVQKLSAGVTSAPKKLVGGKENDLLEGGSGDDTLQGRKGADTMKGGLGNDKYVVNESGDVVDETSGGGTDEIFVTEMTSYTQPSSLFEMVTFPKASESNLQAYGCADCDGTIETSRGDDLIDGKGCTGTMKLLGMDGNDTIHINLSAGTATTCQATVEGGPGNDTITGHTTVTSQDTIYGGIGNDSIVSYLGNDLIYAGMGSDYVDAGAGDDTIWGAAGADSLYGGTGDDIIRGMRGNDYIEGNGGADTIFGGGESGSTSRPTVDSDTLNLGNDTYVDRIHFAGAMSGYTIKNTSANNWTVQDSYELDTIQYGKDGDILMFDGGGGNCTISGGGTTLTGTGCTVTP